MPRLSVKYEELTVNVLNDTVQTFDGMLLKMNLESCDGNIRIPLKALTCSRRVTGSYKAVDWLKYQDWIDSLLSRLMATLTCMQIS